MSILSQPHFHNEEAAYEYVEAKLWPKGAVCPRCNETERVGKMGGKSTRIGVYKCYVCRKPFTVKIGTIFEASHIKMNIWLQAIYLISSSKKGISSNQLHRTLGVTLKSAWFMSHRIREAMKDHTGLLGGGGSVVEVDETFIGGKSKKKAKGARGYHHKDKILSLVERGGRARSFHVPSISSKVIFPILKEHIARDTHINTDEGSNYVHVAQNKENESRPLEKIFDKHSFIKHSRGEYVRGNVTTNTIEGFFSIFKRGMRGVYQHCGTQHLNRYLAEFDFRYSERAANGVNDTERADKLLCGVVGKLLTYQTVN
ncbi:MAG: IS1595 family transposase [Proteobacteria bacterium]|nr:IS1595 family transposase [Pseudomonadota bacterium]